MSHSPAKLCFLVVAGLLGLFTSAPVFATESAIVTGKIIKSHGPQEGPALLMPTGVCVDSDGTIIIADGANDRIVLLASDGMQTEIRQVGDARLSRPLNVKLDSTSRMWIADAGRGRVLVRDKAGALEQTIQLPTLEGGHDPEPTDIVPIGDGSRAWIVDGHNHRLLLWDPAATPVFTAVGKQGATLGSLDYPYFATGDPTGRLLVSDSLNGRIVVLNENGKIASHIGRYGANAGELYRPKGVASDAKGNVWVADGMMGVVQAFTSTGRLLGVLRDATGKTMKFDYPAGLAFGPQGDLYVVELSAHRVQQVELTIEPRQQVIPGPSREQITGGHSLSCTICHIEWLPAFASGEGTELMDLPESSPEDPIASRSITCLSCHDGTVMDSRRKVWVEHGHLVGITPPESMKVPDYLPLIDGKLACRTCHSAHAGGQQSQSLAQAVFVRVEDGTGSLCASCHTDKKMGPAAGAHPVGGMPWTIPDELVTAGAKVGPNPRELTCYVCHEPHGSKEHHLLVMGTESSQLCLTCHTKLRPGMWRPDLPRDHPQNPPLQNDAQRQAIKDMGTHVGEDDTLICLSCHKVHHGLSGRYLLADTLKESQLCLRCHPERMDMVNTSHDLRHSAPECRNRRGQTPEESGPCGACHSFHQFSRMPDPLPRDPTGLCVSCHQDDQCASHQAVTGPTHPYKVKPERLPADLSLHIFPTPDDETTRTIACLTCHDPHDAKHKYFLRDSTPELCAQCHADTVAKLAGSHDLSGRTDLMNGIGQTPADAGKCGFCHSMHKSNGPKLWIGTTTAPADADGTCTACHNPEGLAAKKPATKYHHPTGPKTAKAAAALETDLPLFRQPGDEEGDPYVSCGSCHDPHGDGKVTPALLRGGPPTSDLCTNCHKENAKLAGGWHDVQAHPDKWPESSREEKDRCLSCHQPHSNDPERGLWTVKPRAQYAVEDGVCLGCHQHIEWGGHGTQPAQPASTQPALQSPATVHEPHGLPLVPTSPGKTSGAVGCKTCHNPHGPPDGSPHLLRAGQEVDPAAMCLTCHQGLKHIGMSLHGGERMKEFAGETGRSTRMAQCGLCHSLHPSGDGGAGPFVRARGDVQRCTQCHSREGGAVAVHMPQHLPGLQNVQEPGQPGYLPLVNEAGEVGASGNITCVTCHMPHGRPPSDEFPELDPQKITAEQMRAMMPMVAPYQIPNLCTSCHGFDGLVRFLYWHKPEKRGGTSG